jgi:hypothetical protein
MISDSVPQGTYLLRLKHWLGAYHNIMPINHTWSLYKYSVVRMSINKDLNVWKLHKFSLSELFSRVPRTRNKRATRPNPLAVTYLSSIPFSHNPATERNILYVVLYRLLRVYFTIIPFLISIVVTCGCTP